MRQARLVYGVVIDASTMKVREQETRKARDRLRLRRITRGGGNIAVAQGGPDTGDKSSAHYLHRLTCALVVVMVDGSKVVRCECGHRFGPVSRNWKETALSYPVSPRKYGPMVKLHRDLQMREYVCPGCGVLLSAEIGYRGDPPLWEIELE